MTFENGVATVLIKGDETKTAKGLPTDITYTVTEAAAAGFEITGRTVKVGDGEATTGDRGTLTKAGAKVTIENSRMHGKLMVSKRSFPVQRQTRTRSSPLPSRFLTRRLAGRVACLATTASSLRAVSQPLT